MRRSVFYGIVIFLMACGSTDPKADKEPQKAAPLLQNINSDRFNQSFSLLLNDYYSLKEDFIVEKDSLSLHKIARHMIVSADSLALGEMKADSSLLATARTYALGISAELKGLTGEPGMDGKRRSLQMISDQMYDLIRTVHYNGSVIYHMYCPMAFSDQGANWLSNSSEIRNPYIPKKMIDCGLVRDSIDFRPIK